MVWAASDFQKLLREFQIDVTIAIMTGKESLMMLTPGFGSGNNRACLEYLVPKVKKKTEWIE